MITIIGALIALVVGVCLGMVLERWRYARTYMGKMEARQQRAIDRVEMALAARRTGQR